MKAQEDKIKVLFADDHQMVIDGLRACLQHEPDISIVAEANNGKEVLSKLFETKVDVVVLDIGMPEMDGHETVLEIHKKYPGIKVLILSFHKDESTIEQLLEQNVSGYIVKDHGTAEIVKAIREVAAGNIYYDRETQAVISKIMRSRKSGLNKTNSLSEKEIAVLHFFAQGLSSKEIGVKLSIAVSTVETHKRNAIVKLALKGSGELRRYAIDYIYNLKVYKEIK